MNDDMKQDGTDGDMPAAAPADMPEESMPAPEGTDAPAM